MVRETVAVGGGNKKARAIAGAGLDSGAGNLFLRTIRACCLIRQLTLRCNNPAALPGKEKVMLYQGCRMMVAAMWKGRWKIVVMTIKEQMVGTGIGVGRKAQCVVVMEGCGQDR